MTFDTAMFIVCILVINAFIFAAMRSPAEVPILIQLVTLLFYE
jgi:hypothetical protein